MAKILINDSNKALINNGSAYAVTNMDAKEGITPLTIGNAINDRVLKLYRYGSCSQASTPTPSSPVDIVCNNGSIREDTKLTLDATRITAYISDAGVWRSSSDSYSIKIPVTVGKRYHIVWTDTNSSTVGTIFRYGFTDDITPSTTNYVSQWVRTTPQALNEVEVIADAAYLIIQNGAAVMADNIANERMVVYEGLPKEVISGKNLLDKTDLTGGEYLNINGKASVISTSSVAHTGYIRVKPLTTYTISGCGVVSGVTNVRVCEYSIANEGGFKTYTNGATANEVVTFTTGADTLYVRINLRTYDTSPMLEEGSTNTDYQPYFVMSVPNLYKAGDYADEADLISGVIKRKCGLKVLDGTEGWQGHSTIDGLVFLIYEDINSDDSAVGLSTHYAWTTNAAAQTPDGSFSFAKLSGVRRIMIRDTTNASGTGNTSKAAIKTYLAAQYAAGTPLTVIYPLATATTEQTTPQELNTAAGANTIQSSVSGADIKIVYHISTS